MNAASELDDAEVRAVMAGDRAAWERTASVLAGRVRLMIAGRLSGNAGGLQQVDEIAQEVMTALAASPLKLNHATWDGLKAYVSSMVAHKVVDSLRREARKGVANEVSLDATITALSNSGPLWQCLSIGGTTPSSAASRKEQCSLMLVELGNLKAEHREVITLAFFDQLPTGEIAERLNISRPAASMLLIRAVEALRRRMEQKV